MRKAICILAVAVMTVASFGATAAQARVHHKYVQHHRVVQQPAGEIGYFSSSSAGLHVGVNHPPKNR